MPLRIHLLMHDLRDGPAAEHANIESHALALPDGVRQVHARLSRFGTGSGVDYLWKPFLPWLLRKLHVAEIPYSRKFVSEDPGCPREVSQMQDLATAVQGLGLPAVTESAPAHSYF